MKKWITKAVIGIILAGSTALGNVAPPITQPAIEKATTYLLEKISGGDVRVTKNTPAPEKHPEVTIRQVGNACEFEVESTLVDQVPAIIIRKSSD